MTTDKATLKVLAAAKFLASAYRPITDGPDKGMVAVSAQTLNELQQALDEAGVTSLDKITTEARQGKALCRGRKRVARGWRMPKFGGRGMRRTYGKAPCQSAALANGFCRHHQDQAPKAATAEVK